jgi:UDP-N-acetylmuramoyl-L-alanyl-D-glutamate--2,6-diaminopimelate ligase
MRWHDLLDGVDVLERTGDSSVDVVSVTQDHRRVAPGTCLVCVRGEQHDGHLDAPEAAARGAVALVVERDLDVTLPQARVRDPRAVIGPLASRLAGAPSTAFDLIGVTGTNGKTTTVHLLDAIAAATGATTALIGTLGATIDGVEVAGTFTTPPAEDLQALFVQIRDAGVTRAAMEVSSHALSQHRVDGTRFVVAGFTNLTHEHLDFHGTFAEYLDAKALLFTPEFTPRAAINIDDESGVQLMARARAAGLDVWTVSPSGGAADVRVTDIAYAPDATTFVLTTPVGTSTLRSTLVGAFNVENSAVAAASALLAGMPFEAVAAGLQAPVVVPGRLERIDAGQPFAVIVDFAHTPDSLRRVLIEARRLAPAGRILTVFGCGGDRDRAKRPLMGAAAGALADVVWITDDNPRSEDPDAIVAAIVEGIESTSTPFTVVRDRHAAIGDALRLAAPGDVVVIAGKGHERGQTANGVTTPFDDRDVARTLLHEVRA